jgi:hypothetical protein
VCLVRASGRPLTFTVKSQAMRQTLVAFVLFIAAAPVVAADYRGANFGDDCARVQAQEKARGSSAIPWKQMSGADIYAFQVRENDRDLVMTYFCPKGKLFTVNYSFPTEKLETALQSYRAALDWLSSMFGAPDPETSSG